ncbi:MAG TPA: glycosyltransferase family 4 protein [Steroidobacteraceae bacterium]|jgi:glycosyltransferase involved in cell wall biosynthesis|nr:glycosyltransferase family 4 protein [Steroidobacteraceae bacterium]
MFAGHHHEPSICFVGLANLSVLAREYGHVGVGGAEVQQTLLAKALARRGYEVSMVVADYGQPDGASWDGVTTWRAYNLAAGLPLVRFIHPRWTAVWSALKRADADVYYVSGAGMLLGLVTMFARQYGRKVIFRVASTSDCDPVTLRVKFWRDKRLYAYGLKRADVVLAQTGEQQRKLFECYGRDSRIAASLAEDGGRCPPFDERDIDVLWVGSFRPLKRPQLLLDLARKLPELRFVMAGGPYPDHADLFEDIGRQAAGLANVEFRGAIPYHEVHNLYERARLLVGTSEIEGFPNTYLQAWTHGAPVVAYLDPENLIAQKGLGRVVTTPDEMASAVNAVLAAESEWSDASARSRTYAAARLDENTMLAPYIEAIGTLGNDGSARNETTTSAARAAR